MVMKVSFIMQKLAWIVYGGCTYGTELTITCDAPFGYSPLQAYEARVSAGGSFTIYIMTQMKQVLSFHA